MGVLIVGSVALDSVRTPFGEVDEVLGGSATYGSIAASYFTDVDLVAVVGEDFPEPHRNFLRRRGINVDGLVTQPGRTFRWKGEYGFQLNEAKTLRTELNVLETFQPTLPSTYRQAELVFLANIDPDLQLHVLGQVDRPRLVAADTMNFWIDGKRESLLRVLKEIDLLMINDGEARSLSKEVNLIKAAQWILGCGPKGLIIKRGEHGAMLFNNHRVFIAPAYPLESVFDPTGAGDSFAGGLLGYLAQSGDLSDGTLRRAVIYGSAMASFAVEAFSVERLKNVTEEELQTRVREFKMMTAFEEVVP
jgi:sugar/nucleoside kinase (ribokinase family)